MEDDMSLSSSFASPSASFIIISTILTTIVVGTFVGNFFVIVAILIDKNLQTTANQLVLSLAVADLMVACLVMPLGAYNDLHQGWYLGKEICEFWTSADVLCCTASILNLLAIALDRYWAVTNVDYIYRRTRQRVNTMILCVWLVGAIVSLAPIFGWKDPDFANRVLVEHKCMVSQDVAYQVFATISTFYAPLVVLLALYWRIFQVARKRIHRKPGQGRPAVTARGFVGRHGSAPTKKPPISESCQTITSPTSQNQDLEEELVGRLHGEKNHLTAIGSVQQQVDEVQLGLGEAEQGFGSGNGNPLILNKPPDIQATAATKTAAPGDNNNSNYNYICPSPQDPSGGGQNWAPSGPGRSNDKTIEVRGHLSSRPPLSAAAAEAEEEEDQPSENSSNLQRQQQQELGANQLFAATQATILGGRHEMTSAMPKMDVARETSQVKQLKGVAVGCLDLVLVGEREDGADNNNNKHNLFSLRALDHVSLADQRIGRKRNGNAHDDGQIANSADGSHFRSSMQDQLVAARSCCGCDTACKSASKAKISVRGAQVERKRIRVSPGRRLGATEEPRVDTNTTTATDDDDDDGSFAGPAIECNKNEHLHRCRQGRLICEPLSAPPPAAGAGAPVHDLACPMGQQEGNRWESSEGLVAVASISASVPALAKTPTTVCLLGSHAVSGQNQSPGRRSRTADNAKQRLGAALGCTSQATSSSPPPAPTATKSVTVTATATASAEPMSTRLLGPPSSSRTGRQEVEAGSMDQELAKMNDNKNNESLGRGQARAASASLGGPPGEAAKRTGGSLKFSPDPNSNNQAVAATLDGSSESRAHGGGSRGVEFGRHIVKVEGLEPEEMVLDAAGLDDQRCRLMGTRSRGSSGGSSKQVGGLIKENCWFKHDNKQPPTGCSKRLDSDDHHLSLQEPLNSNCYYCCCSSCCCRLEVCSNRSSQAMAGPISGPRFPAGGGHLTLTNMDNKLAHGNINTIMNNKIDPDKIEALSSSEGDMNYNNGSPPDSSSSTTSSSSLSPSTSTSTYSSLVVACEIHRKPEATTPSKALVIAGLEHGGQPSQTNSGCGGHHELGDADDDDDDATRPNVASDDEDDDAMVVINSDLNDDEEEQSMASLSAAFPPPIELLNRSKPTTPAAESRRLVGTKSINVDDDASHHHKPRRKFELSLEVGALEGSSKGSSGVDSGLGVRSLGAPGELPPRGEQPVVKREQRHRQRVWPAGLAALRPDVGTGAGAGATRGPEHSLEDGPSCGDGCQVQKQHMEEEPAAAAGGLEARGYNHPLKPDNNHTQQQRHTKTRSLDIKRRFRALGQLVSFVQTSRNFNSSSSAAETSQSGEGAEEVDEDEAAEAEAREDAARQRVRLAGAAFVRGAEKTIGLYNVSAKLARGNPHVEVKQPPLAGLKSSSMNPSARDNSLVNHNHDHKYHNHQVRRASASPEHTGGRGSACTMGHSSSSGGQHQPRPQGMPAAAAAAAKAARSANRPKMGASLMSEPGAGQFGGRAGSRRANLDMKREKKAAKTLAIITGVFVCCWLPFFLNAIIMPICGPSCTPSDLVLSILLWLGYLNSLLNPIIYTIFSPDFRLAFRRLLCWPPMAAMSASGMKSFR